MMVQTKFFHSKVTLKTFNNHINMITLFSTNLLIQLKAR